MRYTTGGGLWRSWLGFDVNTDLYVFLGIGFVFLESAYM
jgi:hypothetical protein